MYLDPPYYPLTKTASFTKYNFNDFTKEDQTDLAKVFRMLDEKGCYVLLSNSNSDFIKELYNGYIIQELEANRYINRNASKRGKQKVEVLIKNY